MNWGVLIKFISCRLPPPPNKNYFVYKYMAMLIKELDMPV